MTFLKAALNAQRKARGEAELTTPDFMRKVRGGGAEPEHLAGHAQAPGQCRLFRRREEAHGNPADGAAGAALRHSRRNRLRPRHRRAAHRAPTASTRCASRSAAFLVITHYQRLLDYITPDVVHVMAKGASSNRGGPELALELERNGYRRLCERGGVRGMTLHRESPRPRRDGRSPSSSPLARRGAVDARERPSTASSEAGLPTRRVEAWHYTDLRAKLRERRAARRDARRGGARGRARRLASLARAGGTRLVLVDGFFAAELSDDPPPAGRRRSLPARAAKRRRFGDADAMLDLNAAFAQGGFVIEIGRARRAPLIEIVALLRGAAAPGALSPPSSSLGAGAQRQPARDARRGRRRAWRQRLVPGSLGRAPKRRLCRRDRGRRGRSMCESSRRASGGARPTRALRLRRRRRASCAGRFSLLRRRERARFSSRRRSPCSTGSATPTRRSTSTHDAPPGVSRETFKHIVADEGERRVSGQDRRAARTRRRPTAR